MTMLETAEMWGRWLGGAVGIALHIVLLIGLIRALSKPSGRSSGSAGWQRSPLVIAGGLVVYILFFYVMWAPIVIPPADPIRVPEPLRWVLLVAGGLMFLSGVGIMVWGRAALGEMYDLSSSSGAKLFEGHRLITSGPYALVRNPMYVGGFLAITGGLLLFQTWMMLALMWSLPGLFGRARREEEALSAEFGDAWAAYARRVPAWLPRLPRQSA